MIICQTIWTSLILCKAYFQEIVGCFCYEHTKYMMYCTQVTRSGKVKVKAVFIAEIPGCPSPNHGSFLTQLVDLLTREMAAAGGALPPSLTSSANLSLEEKAVLWKAITADKNNDEVCLLHIL